MKKVFFILLPIILMLILSCRSTNNSSSTIIIEDEETEHEENEENEIALTTFSFDKELHDFGDITDKEPVETNYVIKNTGASPLFILDVKPSCVCTTSEYSKESIAPGKSSDIKIVFDPSDRVGVQKKSVTIETNSKPAKKVISFSANIITN